MFEIFSFEFVLLKDSDLKKYGLATVKLNDIVNDVRLAFE